MGIPRDQMKGLVERFGGMWNGYTWIDQTTYLETAGESGMGLVEFFNNFRYQEVLSEARRFPFFRSHPLSSSRIEALRRLVEASPNYDKAETPERAAEHALVVAKIHAFMDPPNQTLRKYPSSNTTLPGFGPTVMSENRSWPGCR